MNRKRVQRLWREEGLRVPLKRRKRQRLGDSAQPARRLSAERPNHVWALDFQFDQTADGRVLKLLNIATSTRGRRSRSWPPGASPPTPRPQRSRGSSPGAGRRRGTSAATTGPSSRPALRAGAGSAVRAAATSSRCAVGKPIRRVVQRPAARRVPGRRAVRQPARGAGADRGLADRVQHEAPAQQPGLARPGYLRRALGGSATRWTLISGGLAKGVRSPPRRPADAGAHAALDQPHRKHALDLPRARQEREALARRADGAALVRRRHAGSVAAVPPRQRAPAPARAKRRARPRARSWI